MTGATHNNINNNKKKKKNNNNMLRLSAGGHYTVGNCTVGHYNQCHPCPQVFKIFRDIATAEGKASQDRKKALIQKLLRSAQGIESGFIIRALQGKLRIGLAEQSVLVALAHAAVLAKNAADDRREAELAGILEEAAQLVKQAYSECPSFDDLVPALLQHPIADLPQYVHFRPGVPVRPMLAKPTVGVGEVLDKFSGQEFTCEYKYDGERAQVHVLEDGSVRVRGGLVGIGGGGGWW